MVHRVGPDETFPFQYFPSVFYTSQFSYNHTLSLYIMTRRSAICWYTSHGSQVISYSSSLTVFVKPTCFSDRPYMAIELFWLFCMSLSCCFDVRFVRYCSISVIREHISSTFLQFSLKYLDVIHLAVVDI